MKVVVRSLSYFRPDLLLVGILLLLIGVSVGLNLLSAWPLGFPTKIQSSVASCDRVFHVLDQEPSVKESPIAVALPVAPRRLVLDNVSFGYASGVPVLP